MPSLKLVSFHCARVGCGVLVQVDPNKRRAGDSLVYCPDCNRTLREQAKARSAPAREWGTAFGRVRQVNRARSTGRRAE